jgi:dUTP pyrophosphatase
VNHDPIADYVVQVGDRIAQLVVLAVPTLEFQEVDELPAATRGADGFGSTGK